MAGRILEKRKAPPSAVYPLWNSLGSHTNLRCIVITTDGPDYTWQAIKLKHKDMNGEKRLVGRRGSAKDVGEIREVE